MTFAVRSSVIYGMPGTSPNPPNTVLVAHDSPAFLRETSAILGDALTVHTVEVNPASVEVVAASSNVAVIVTEVGTPGGLSDAEIVDLVARQRDSAFLVRVPAPELLAAKSHTSCPFRESAVVAIESSRWHEDLVLAVNNAIACPPATTRRMTLEHCVERRATFELPNEPMLIESVAADLVGLADAWHLSPQDAFRLRAALVAAVRHAVYRGNLEIHDADPAELAARRRDQRPYSGRRVRVEARVDSARGRFVVRHEGPGFDGDAIERLGWQAAHNLDEVRLDDDGRAVTLVKRNPGLRTAAETSLAATVPVPPTAPPPPPPVPASPSVPERSGKNGSDPVIPIEELGGDLGSAEVPIVTPEEVDAAEERSTPGRAPEPVAKRSARTSVRIDRDVTDLLQMAPKADPFGED